MKIIVISVLIGLAWSTCQVYKCGEFQNANKPVGEALCGKAETKETYLVQNSCPVKSTCPLMNSEYLQGKSPVP